MKYLITALLALVAAAGVATAQGRYQISPGDRLSIEVLEDPALNREALVLPDGRFSFPFAGTVVAAGRTVEEVENALETAIAPNFASSPNVFVTVQSAEGSLLGDLPLELPTITVYMMGEVESPGAKDLTPGTTFLQAMALTGGMTRFAAQNRVQLRRPLPGGRSQVVEINFRALSNGAALSRDIVLGEGDVILVPERRLFE